MRYMVFRIVFLIGLWCCNSTLTAQCDGSIKPVSNEKIAYKTRENRCEGFFTSKVASNRLRLVSFTLGDFSFAAEEDEIIEIQSNEPKLVLKAEGIPNDLFYRMDAEITGGSLKWPVKDVLLQNDRTRLARNIGLLAFREDPVLHKVFSPIKAKGKHVAGDQNTLPLLKLICTTSLVIVEWRIKGEEKYRRLEKSSFIAHTPIYIRIPADIKGEKQIQIRAKESSSIEWLNLNISIKI